MIWCGPSGSLSGLIFAYEGFSMQSSECSEDGACEDSCVSHVLTRQTEEGTTDAAHGTWKPGADWQLTSVMAYGSAVGKRTRTDQGSNKEGPSGVVHIKATASSGPYSLEEASPGSVLVTRKIASPLCHRPRPRHGGLSLQTPMPS